MNKTFLPEHLAALVGVKFLFWNNENIETDTPHPLLTDETLRSKIMLLADRQEEPLIYTDAQRVVFLCLKSGSGYCFFGPISLHAMDRVQLHKFYRGHGVTDTEDRPIPVLSASKVILLAQLAAGIIQGSEYSEEEILRANISGIPAGSTEPFHLSMHEEDERSYHHTFQDERRITDAVEEGRTEDAVKFSVAMDDEVGKVGAGYLEQAQRTAIVSITVCTRAAIRGGVSPSEAYQISDFYMQRLDECPSEGAMLSCRNEAIRTLTERVRAKKEQRNVSTYVEACSDYVGKHYREKIYLDDIAKKMGISPTYLSRLFSKEKGVTLQEYITRVRVDRAANLLTYSDSPIAKIGDYVGFPSQSYFGRIFKQHTGLTPKQYRNAHKPREFNKR